MSNEPAAHRAPCEVIDEIALRASVEYKEQLSDFTEEHMFTFNLVNRRWSQLCRPFMWSRITIASEARHQSICAILDIIPPPSLVPLTDLIRGLCYQLAQGDGTPPWFHRLHNALASRLSHTPSIELVLPVKGNATLDSFVPDLPRALPSMRLALDKVNFCFSETTCFRSRGALLRLLATAPQLQSIIFRTKVTWVSDALPPPSLALNSSLCKIDLASPRLGTDDVTWWLPPLIGHRSRPTSRDARALQESCVLQESEFEAMASVMRCIISRFPLGNFELTRSYDSSADLHTVTIRLTYDLKCLEEPENSKPDIQWSMMEIVMSYESPKNALPSFNPTSPNMANIIQVTFNFIKFRITDFWAMEDWEHVIVHLSHLSDLKRVFLSFPTTDGAAQFVDKYGAAFLARGTISNKVSISNDGGAKWKSVRQAIKGKDVSKVEAEDDELLVLDEARDLAAFEPRLRLFRISYSLYSYLL